MGKIEQFCAVAKRGRLNYRGIAQRRESCVLTTGTGSGPIDLYL
jgi:hypothetical protein